VFAEAIEQIIVDQVPCEVPGLAANGEIEAAAYLNASMAAGEPTGAKARAVIRRRRALIALDEAR
jgi:hypothetical protein